MAISLSLKGIAYSWLRSAESSNKFKLLPSLAQEFVKISVDSWAGYQWMLATMNISRKGRKAAILVPAKAEDQTRLNTMLSAAENM